MTRLWTLRETGASATALNLAALEPDPIVGWEDAAVDPLRLGDYLREFSELVARFGYRTSIYGHFGDGCVHARINFDLRTEQGVAHWRDFLREAVPARGEVRRLAFRRARRRPCARRVPAAHVRAGAHAGVPRVQGGVGSGQPHEPGKDRRPVPRRRAPAPRAGLQAVSTLQTRFAFKTPEGTGFSRAVGHCVGMGKCRASKGGTMCPSYRATREERYSTRGRARLLGEMLRGELITDGWQSEAVKDALDWCLACKGCRSDCPTHTDMAAYKAEFMSHYYESRRRPRQAWSMGRIGEWAPLAACAPGLANVLSSTNLVKRLAGVAVERTLPKFAPKTFRSTFVSEKRGEPVVLLDDCFNNHFRPASAHAAQAVLEKAGRAVELPRETDLLRPSLLRLRHARAGAACARARVAGACAAAPARARRGGARAGLPVRVPRRDARAFAGR